MKGIVAALLVLALAVSRAYAQAEAPLYPEDVAISAARHYPAVLAAIAERRGAAGELLSARGAFDVVVTAEGRARTAGYYSGDFGQVKVERPLGGFGAKAYASYRLSDGTFPIYEDEAYTNKSGEAKIGVLFSLLRDRTIDDRRAGIAEARLGLQQAELEVRLTRLAVQREALLAYHRWVARGRELSVYEDLLELAEERIEGLEEEVRRGARAAIFLTENAQNLTRRRELAATARRDLALAANDLALYLRTEEGRMLTPDRSQIPKRLPEVAPAATPDVAAITGERPELALLNLAAERASLALALAENELRPRLDTVFEVAQDFGPVAEGGLSRDEGEIIAGLRFELPLGRRGARGRVAAADAQRDRTNQELRLARDRILAELTEVVLDLETSGELLELAMQEVRQAETMRAAEQRRFAAGASDFFLLNLREEALADARVRLARAKLARSASRVTYDAAVLDEEALGLTAAQ
ncbi:TolC family protein [Parvularcula dongshanensis]|uniref:Outer membrane protein TolC n=1 Tax=Parvularcula dongshanensis TaxID=1173995 RepID=A0A840I844_9PROT|nr:TolC family protein [Parvularcula dongshanensis]MBB4660278.1 outer membrane protein TolC [Parvularcula dongshanensis]